LVRIIIEPEDALNVYYLIKTWSLTAVPVDQNYEHW